MYPRYEGQSNFIDYIVVVGSRPWLVLVDVVADGGHGLTLVVEKD